MKETSKRILRPFKRFPIELLSSTGMLIFNLIPRVDLFDRLRYLILRAMGLKRPSDYISADADFSLLCTAPYQH